MRRAVIIAVGLVLGAGLACADDLVITSFSGNGEVTWTYPTNGVDEYRVEWCSDLTEGLWCDLEGGLRGIAPTGGTMTASVPMFYRMKSMGPEPTNMVYIPAGWFDMGNCMETNEGTTYELPVHRVYVSGFYMDQYEVSSNLWDEVHTWALGTNYEFDNTGLARGLDHPVYMVSWHDCVKWANARSEREGLRPCYYVDTNHTVICKSGTNDMTSANVDWGADGYRLPTEAEWEKAARGGASGHRFPWADDTISHGRANYNAGGEHSYDLSDGSGPHPDYSSEGTPYTSPVGSFTANGYGLYDMAGNLSEWCWDRWSDYGSSPETDPQGPDSDMSYRIFRDGFMSAYPSSCRVANRFGNTPDTTFNILGFRLVRATQ